MRRAITTGRPEASFSPLHHRIATMNGAARLRRALIPKGKKSGLARTLAPPGSWKASTIPESRIGAMNPIVLVLVLVLVLETKLAGRGRVRERGRGRRDGSWEALTA